MESFMLLNYIDTGTKLELKVSDREAEILGLPQKTYCSEVYDVLSEDEIEITMPMEKAKLYLLSDLYEYDLFFYSPVGGLYKSTGKILEHYKKGNFYLFHVNLTSSLRRFQRREYYRFNCALELNLRELDEQESDGIRNGNNNWIKKGLPLKKAVIVDISGGGMRFLSNSKFPADSLVLCVYTLATSSGDKKFTMAGEVLASKMSENKKNVYEHRLKFINIDVDTREAIIKYIFDAERKNRKNETFYK